MHLLDLETRKRIYDSIAQSPGIHFREIQRRTELATGSVDYHLHFLHKNGLIRTEKAGRFLRFYPTNVSYTEEDKELLSLLRQERVRHVLMFLIEKKRANAKNISAALNITPSNLSWYLKMLKEKNLISEKKKRKVPFYSVIKESKEKIVRALVTYRASFFDAAVDRFIEAWEMD